MTLSGYHAEESAKTFEELTVEEEERERLENLSDREHITKPIEGEKDDDKGIFFKY